MSKISLSPTTLLMPVPTVLVTAMNGDKPNIITLAWVGTVCSDPAMLSISIRPSRFSHGLIKDTKEFVVNIPSEALVRQTDECGIVSGKDVDKFEESGLTAVAATKVDAPLIKECPVNLECRASQIINLGAHDLFLGEILAVHANEEVLTDGKLDVGKVRPFAYCKHEYWSLKERIGSYGFSKKSS